MRRSWSRLFLALAIIGCAAVLSSTPALAQKGKPQPPPPPPPPGTIYYPVPTTSANSLDLPWKFNTADDGGFRLWAMNADGSNRRQLPYDQNVVNPSNLIYGGGYRWSLFSFYTGEHYDRTVRSDGTIVEPGGEQREIFAIRPDGAGGFEVLQLTDLFGLAWIDPYSQIRWSTDGVDSFISFAGRDLRNAVRINPDDGATELHLADVEGCIIRVPVSGLELHQMASIGPWVPFGPDECDIVVHSDFGPNQFQLCHTWSPDGTRIAFIDQAEPWGGWDLWVTDLLTGSTTRIWDVATYDALHYSSGVPRWRPNGNSILADYSSTGSVLINADGSGGVPTPTGIDTHWSPDGNHSLYLAGSTVRIKGVNYQVTNLYRYDWATGQATKITNNDVGAPASQESHVYWVSNSFAP